MGYLLESRRLSADGQRSPLKFTLTSAGGMPNWNRALCVHGREAFHVGNVCDTCGFFFEKLADPEISLEIENLRASLEAGLSGLPGEVTDPFALLLPQSKYLVALLNVIPDPVRMRTKADYFAHEDVRFDESWLNHGPPEIHDPKTDYYRARGRSDVNIADELDEPHGFELFVPMMASDRLDRERVDFYKQALSGGRKPTAVSLSVLDIKTNLSNDRAHWCLAHYSLDGHHKMAAAAETGSEIGLLSFIALDHGISAPEHVERWFERFA